MTVLGIETSTAVCSVAIVGDGGMRTERQVVESHVHSEKLLTLVQEVCEASKIRLREVDGVAVSIGPGSFTGLRIGLSAAKGLCVGLARPLLTVPTFAAIADAAFAGRSGAGTAMVCVDARQGDYYVGRFVRADGRAAARSSVEALPLGAVEWHPGADVVITDRVEQVREYAAPATAIVDVLQICSALPVAERGMELLRHGMTADVANSVPYYLKDFVVRPGNSGAR